MFPTATTTDDIVPVVNHTGNSSSTNVETSTFTGKQSVISSRVGRRFTSMVIIPHEISCFTHACCISLQRIYICTSVLSYTLKYESFIL